MKIKFALGLLLAFWTSPALANIPAPSNNWVVTGRSPYGDTALVDAGTVIRQGNHAGYWFQVNRANGVINRSYNVADCTNGAIVPMWSVVANNGAIVQNEAITNPVAFNITPGSLGEGVYRSVCFGTANAFQDSLNQRIMHNAEMINRAMEAGARLAR